MPIFFKNLKILRNLTLSFPKILKHLEILNYRTGICLMPCTNSYESIVQLSIVWLRKFKTSKFEINSLRTNCKYRKTIRRSNIPRRRPVWKCMMITAPAITSAVDPRSAEKRRRRRQARTSLREESSLAGTLLTLYYTIHSTRSTLLLHTTLKFPGRRKMRNISSVSALMRSKQHCGINGTRDGVEAKHARERSAGLASRSDRQK